MDERKMPQRLQFGQFMSATVGHAIHNWRERDHPNPHNYRAVMGYFLPSWQRGLVWTAAQNMRLIESLWLGINIGTYTYNRSPRYDLTDPLDNLLIDGQQRLNAIQQYLSDAFPVFGWKWSEVSEPERRSFDMSTHFHCYITNSTDEAYLRGYYDLTNFGGTAHDKSERAT